MIHSHKDLLKRRVLYAGGDVICAICSAVMLFTFQNIIICVCFTAISSFTCWLSGFYNRPFGKSRLQELCVTSATAGFLSLVCVVLFQGYFSIAICFGFPERFLEIFAVLFIPCYVFRFLITVVCLSKDKEHRGEETICVAFGTVNGIGCENARLSEKSQARTRYKIAGSIYPGSNESKDAKLLNETLKSHDAEFLLIIQDEMTGAFVADIVRICIEGDIPVRIAPGMMSFITSSIRLKDIYGEPFVDLSAPVMSDFGINLKRLADILISGIGMVSLFPLMAVVAIAIKIEGRGSVIYSQKRLGRNFRQFEIFKFRSMVENAENGVPQLSHEGDLRVTRIGKFLRRYRIDELPQLWNVLKGEMSLVGPRPERPYFASLLAETAPGFILTMQVRPGLTSWGMVRKGYATNISEMRERLQYDLLYVSNMSLLIDVKILIYTVKIILTGKGI